MERGRDDITAFNTEQVKKKKSLQKVHLKDQKGFTTLVS